jgi:hypothetical protein
MVWEWYAGAGGVVAWWRGGVVEWWRGGVVAWCRVVVWWWGAAVGCHGGVPWWGAVVGMRCGRQTADGSATGQHAPHSDTVEDAALVRTDGLLEIALDLDAVSVAPTALRVEPNLAQRDSLGQPRAAAGLFRLDLTEHDRARAVSGELVSTGW